MSVVGIVEPTQFLTFHLDKEVFAIDISKIKEVLEFTDLTHIPSTPDFMCGVINLRGSVVPIIDLRLKFGMANGKRTVNTCFIIIDVKQENGTTVIGAMADSVKEVMELNPDQIEPPPKVGTGLRADYICGMGKLHDNFVILLDTDKIFSVHELNTIRNTSVPLPNQHERAA
ncbi:MAG: purine-binding chemotaxis protein CheW [Magnetococcales bacterium]|nr:purine-binding chemotaxis protein CheW [Magnetococcales bacterium]MBF0150397.1 purine-binding chemotaxis protein CheW [Magnetococcales bacterium]MBF0172111.1 purine-binding chemotaxis protein CheW [Magnetococcales bacterium]MBF0629886.1 purine-binding chemotaxis protein CheW [Magnetococcales bacterium]